MSGIYQFKSTDLGAPVLNGIGGLIGVMDGIRNGYGSVAVVSMTRSGDTVTVETSVAHGLATLNVAEISGAVETAYNGQWPVATVPDSTHYTFKIATTPSSPATGTISSKRGGTGWVKAFTGTNVAAYRLPTLSPSTGMYLRVDDTAADVAAVLGYETMSDVNTGTGPFPSSGISSWRKNAAGAAVRPWVAYSDGLFLWLFIRWHASTYANSAVPNGFGDIIPTSSVDAFHCSLHSENANNTGGPYLNTDFGNLSSDFNGVQQHFNLARGYNQIGSAVKAGKMSLGGASTLASYVLPYPAPHDNGMYVAPFIVGQGSVPRGRLPGMMALLHASSTQLTNLTNLDRVSGLANLPGRTVELVRFAANTGAQDAFLAVDITGPWR